MIRIGYSFFFFLKKFETFNYLFISRLYEFITAKACQLFWQLLGPLEVGAGEELRFGHDEACLGLVLGLGVGVPLVRGLLHP